MNYPKIFYKDYFIEFGANSDSIEFRPESFTDFLDNPKENLKIFVDEQPTYHAIWKQMLKILEPIEAAGGLIQNLENKYLMIFRNQKWDLPKGKIDKGESPEDAALREIEEEVNLNQNFLKINKFICLTYHIYKQNATFFIKSTYWYEVLYTSENYQLIPQTAENITEVQWLTKDELLSKDTYPSIKSVLENYFL
jgi:8-oxo-dGTP pyrophosphatase MutT (NUDIX family)